MELSQYGELFLSESREHISTINHLLLTLEADASAREPVEGIFRAVHTIKGMSATMGFQGVADLAHELENLLDQLRRGERSADDQLVDLLFTCADALERTVEASVVEREGEFDLTPLISRLREMAHSPSGASAVISPDGVELSAGEVPEGTLRVTVRVSSNAPLPGVRAFLVLRRARDLGSVEKITPPEEALQGPDFTGTFAFQLRTEEAAEKIREALLQIGELEDVEVASPSAPQVVPAVSIAPAVPRAEAEAGETVRARSIRVDLRRLDALMNEVGELVIVRDRLQRLAAGQESTELGEAVDQAARLISELQDEVMRVRMVPVAQVFDRFPRLVRDAARSLGKRVDFVIDGKDIEFDRSMLDEMGDPLVHLLRNSLDHGIEGPEDREAAGKPAAGQLRLSASRERSRAVIRVEDDGRGINRERVAAKAVERGLFTREAVSSLSDDEIFRLLTTPGFSTAERVSDVSGRGVGLDVVATRVRSLGGTMEIASREGEGTIFTLRLPLTLAIVRALLVRCGDQTFALPLAHVGESVEFPRSEVRSIGGRTVVLLREEVIPLLRLHDVLRQEREAVPAPAGEIPVVIVEVGEQRVGVEVDDLVGQQEIVVKGFDSTVDTLRIFSGATILSDGRPALILDAGSLIHQLGRAEGVHAG